MPSEQNTADCPLIAADCPLIAAGEDVLALRSAFLINGTSLYDWYDGVVLGVVDDPDDLWESLHVQWRQGEAEAAEAEAAEAVARLIAPSSGEEAARAEKAEEEVEVAMETEREEAMEVIKEAEEAEEEDALMSPWEIELDGGAPFAPSRIEEPLRTALLRGLEAISRTEAAVRLEAATADEMQAQAAVEAAEAVPEVPPEAPPAETAEAPPEAAAADESASVPSPVPSPLPSPLPAAIVPLRLADVATRLRGGYYRQLSSLAHDVDRLLAHLRCTRRVLPS